MQLTKEEQIRYSRHVKLSEIGESGQEKLKMARVVVIGAGGLGCPALQYLAAAGVGTIGIVDYDTVESSNLQRQILFNSSMIGESKAEKAAEVLRKLNPYITVKPYHTKLTFENAVEIIQPYDIVIDGSDNFATRYLVNDVCFLLKKPFCFGSMFKFEGQVSVFNLDENSPTYRCLFPEPPQDTSILNCAEAGVIGVLPGIIGSMQALEAIKIITGIGESLSGYLMCFNGLTQEWIKLNIERNSKIEDITPSTPAALAQTDYSRYDNACQLETLPEISPEEFRKRAADFTLIDIREKHETPKIEDFEFLSEPLSTLNYSALEKIEGKIVVVCQSGIRSARLISQLLEKGFDPDRLYNLKGGVNELYRFTPES